MKQNLHRLLSLLLALAMLVCLVPAAFAIEDEGGGDGEVTPPPAEVVHDGTHELAYTPNSDGLTHTVRCSVPGCNFTETTEACTYGEAMWDQANGHVEICTKCSRVKSESCELEYVFVAQGMHQRVCAVCGHIYEPATACRVEQWTPDGKGRHTGVCSDCKTAYTKDCEDANKDGKCDVCGGAVEVTPAKQTITGFERVPNITAPVGTAQSAVGLPSTVLGYISDRKTVLCAVTWTCNNYNPNRAGTYTFTGSITVPQDCELAYGVSATLTVSVTLQDYSIKISADNSSVSVGSTKNLTATVTSPVGAAGNLTVEWSVSDRTGKIATVSSSSGWWGGNDRTGTLRAISAGSSTSGTNVTVTATLKSGSTVLATSNSVSVRIVPATASVIRSNAVGSSVRLGEDSFYRALADAGLGNALNYVVFDTPSSSKGALYAGSGVNATKLSYGSKCYYGYSRYDNGYDLDTVYFEYGSNASGAVTLSYVAYNDDGYVIATGTVELSGTAATIRYHIGSDGKVTFNEDDFRSALRTGNYNYGSTLDYVQFDMSEAVFGNSYGGSSKYGYLYVDSGLKTKLTASNDSYKFAYQYSSSSSRYYYDLDDVTYVAGSETKTYSVMIPFVAYGTKNESVRGMVEIVVDAGVVNTFNIDATGVGFKAAATAILEDYPNASYLMLEQPDNGTLYYNYNAINNYGHKLRGKDAYYFDPSAKDAYDLDNVWLVPAAGATKVTVRFDVYTNRSKTDSGSITFTVRSRTASRVFSDVTYNNTGSWAADSVDFMNANGLIYGTGKSRFQPNGTMTRGDLVLILYRLAGQPSVSRISNPFKDVSPDDYYYKAVLWAYANQVVNGTGRDTFSPKKAITREQLAAILYRYSGSPGSSIHLSAFTDAGKVSSFAVNAMRWAVGAGIITGSGSKLDPQSSATRAQVAAMLHRYLTK